MNKFQQIWRVLTKPSVYWRLFSLLLAIIFWLLTAGDGNLGGTERVINLKLEVRNLPSNVVVIDAPELVRVRIRGLSPILNRGEESMRAWINLANSEEGVETAGVEVEAPVGIEIVSITPRWVSIALEELTTEVFPVALALLGLEAISPGVSVNPDPPMVTVKAPRSILEQVARVVAYVNIEQNLKSTENEFLVQALNMQGKTLSSVEIIPSSIGIQVVLEKDEQKQIVDFDGEE